MLDKGASCTYFVASRVSCSSVLVSVGDSWCTRYITTESRLRLTLSTCEYVLCSTHGIQKFIRKKAAAPRSTNRHMTRDWWLFKKGGMVGGGVLWMMSTLHFDGDTRLELNAILVLARRGLVVSCLGNRKGPASACLPRYLEEV